MELLAIRSFKNPQRALVIENALHPDHVHKGATFEIGGKAPFEQLTGDDKKLVGLLNHANCVGLPTPANIAQVAAEVAEEAAREATRPAPQALFDKHTHARFK